MYKCVRSLYKLRAGCPSLRMISFPLSPVISFSLMSLFSSSMPGAAQSWTHIPRSLPAVDRIHGAGMQSGGDEGVDEHVRTLFVLDRHLRVLAIVLSVPEHDLLVHSTARNEEGRGGLGQLLLSPLPLLPHLVPGGGEGLEPLLVLSRHPVLHQLVVDRRWLDLLPTHLPHADVEEDLEADARVPPQNPTAAAQDPGLDPASVPRAPAHSRRRGRSTVCRAPGEWDPPDLVRVVHLVPTPRPCPCSGLVRRCASSRTGPLRKNRQCDGDECELTAVTRQDTHSA